jgi:TonB family protein
MEFTRSAARYYHQESFPPLPPSFRHSCQKRFRELWSSHWLWMAQGNPQNVKIKQSAGFGLDDEAMAAVKQYKFAPATLHGNPVPVYVDIRVDFKRY